MVQFNQIGRYGKSFRILLERIARRDFEDTPRWLRLMLTLIGRGSTVYQMRVSLHW